MKIRKAVIPAAGWGLRFLPVTKSVPKEMLPLVNKPLIQYGIEEAIACGIESVIIVTAPGKRAINDYFDRSIELEHMLEQKGNETLLEEVRRLSNMVDLSFVIQPQPTGLGQAVLTARQLVGNEPFVLLLPDDIFERGELVLKKMIDVYQTYGGSVIAIKQVPRQETVRYGIILPGEKVEAVYSVWGLVEKPRIEEAPSDLAIMGRYVLAPEIFEALERTHPDRNGELQLTDALQQLLQECPVYGYEFEGQRYDAGTPYGWLETTVALALKDTQLGPRLKEYLKSL
jgi:UTP--glucose-1-phosphate uridylyltransferase